MSKITSLTDRRNLFYWQMDRPISEREITDIFLNRHSRFDSKLTTEMIQYGMQSAGKSKTAAGVVDLTSPTKVGSVNMVSKATLADGTKIVIRVHPQEVANGYFWAESTASQLAKDVGVPTYATYFIDDSNQKFPNDFMIIEQLPGEIMQLTWPIPEDLDKIHIEETGRYMALTHTIKTKGFGFFDNTIAKKEKRLQAFHTKWKEHIYASFFNNLDYLTKNVVLSTQERTKIEALFAKNENVMSCDDPRLVQNDIADWNQLIYNSHVSGILDWDECFSGDPICDLATWTVFFPFERFEHLKRGYQQVSPLPDGFEEKFHLYRLRYIISKLVGRKKKLMYKESQFTQKLYDYALKILQDEFKWFGVK